MLTIEDLIDGNGAQVSMLPDGHQAPAGLPFSREWSSWESILTVLVPQRLAGMGLLTGMELFICCCQSGTDLL